MTAPAATEKKPKLVHAQPAPQREPVQVSPDRMEIREQRNMDWTGKVPIGTTAADLHRNPNAFALCQHLLTLGDGLTLFTMDGATMFRGVVVKGDRAASCMVHITDTIPLPKPADADGMDIPDGYAIRRAGVGDDQEGWLCIRTSDNLVMNSGHPIHQRADALHWLLNHAAVRAGGTVPKAMLS